MPRFGPGRVCLFAALALPLVACDPNEITDDDDDTDPVVVTIEQGEAVALARRELVDLTVVDQNGESVSGVTWSIVGADEFTLSVVALSNSGRVTGRDIGSAFVRAMVGESSDSIRVDVSVGALHEGEVHVVMTGDVEREYVLSEELHMSRFPAFQLDVLDRPEWSRAHFQAFPGQGGPAGHPFSEMLLAVPDSFTIGTHTVGRYEAGTDFMVLPLDLDSVYAHLYEGHVVVTGGSVEISAATSPERGASGRTGSVEGTADLAADLYTSEYDQDTQSHVFTPTGESVDLAVTFHVLTERWRGGWIDVTADGAGYAAESWDVYARGFHDTVDGAGVSTPLDGEIYLSVGFPEPATGTFSVETGEAWVYLVDDCAGCAVYLEAEGTAGTVEVTEFTARTATAWGVLRGTLDVTLTVLVDETGDPGETFTLTGSFATWF